MIISRPCFFKSNHNLRSLPGPPFFYLLRKETEKWLYLQFLYILSHYICSNQKSENVYHKYTVKCSHDYFKTLFFEIEPQLKKFARSSFFLFIKKRNREMTISAIPVYIKPLYLF